MYICLAYEDRYRIIMLFLCDFIFQMRFLTYLSRLATLDILLLSLWICVQHYRFYSTENCQVVLNRVLKGYCFFSFRQPKQCLLWREDHLTYFTSYESVWLAHVILSSIPGICLPLNFKYCMLISSKWNSRLHLQHLIKWSRHSCFTTSWSARVRSWKPLIILAEDSDILCIRCQLVKQSCFKIHSSSKLVLVVFVFGWFRHHSGPYAIDPIST